MKCNGVNVILRGIVHVVSCFTLHFMLYRGNFNYFSDSVAKPEVSVPTWSTAARATTIGAKPTDSSLSKRA